MKRGMKGNKYRRYVQEDAVEGVMSMLEEVIYVMGEVGNMMEVVETVERVENIAEEELDVVVEVPVGGRSGGFSGRSGEYD